MTQAPGPARLTQVESREATGKYTDGRGGRIADATIVLVGGALIFAGIVGVLVGLGWWFERMG